MALEIDQQENILSSRKIFGERVVPPMAVAIQKLGIRSESVAFKILVGISVVCLVLAFWIISKSIRVFSEPKTGRIIVNETPTDATK